MRTLPAQILGATLVLVLALSGCGSSDSAPGPTPIQLTSTAISRHSVPALYTCDGKDTSPPLRWGAVPSATSELLLLVVGFEPKGANKSYSISIEWAVAGINPQLHSLAAGRLPPGAYVGHNSDGRQGYSICPRRGQSELYQFTLYAVPGSLTIPQGFEGISALASLSRRGSSTSAIGRGALVAAYKRS